jgi:hypothetical protein
MEYRLSKPQKIMLYAITPGNFRLIDNLKSFCIFANMLSRFDEERHNEYGFDMLTGDNQSTIGKFVPLALHTLPLPSRKPIRVSPELYS